MLFLQKSKKRVVKKRFFTFLFFVGVSCVLYITLKLVTEKKQTPALCVARNFSSVYSSSMMNQPPM